MHPKNGCEVTSAERVESIRSLGDLSCHVFTLPAFRVEVRNRLPSVPHVASGERWPRKERYSLERNVSVARRPCDKRCRIR